MVQYSMAKVSSGTPIQYNVATQKLMENKVNYNLPKYSSGKPFMNYKAPGAYMTDFTPAGNNISAVQGQLNMQADNTGVRNFMTTNGIPMQNNALQNWTYTIQSFSKPNFNTYSCTSDGDCDQFNTEGIKYTCNPNYLPWDMTKGNQPGPVCSRTVFPEIMWTNDGGAPSYFRNLGPGGITTQCYSDSECAEGYSCNMGTGVNFAESIQQASQTGYCAQPYECDDGETRYLSATYNNMIPMVNPEQNNNGKGYKNQTECMAEATPLQRCVENQGSWYALFPGYCPIPAEYRNNSNPQGQLRNFKTSKDSGFTIPTGLAPGKPSTMGTLSALQSMKKTSGPSEPISILANMNGLSTDQTKRQQAFFR